MKFYLDTSHYIDRKDWVNVPHVIRPYFVDGDKKVEKRFLELLAGSHAEGDFSILPMNLEYYYIRNKKDQMESYIAEAHKVGKKVIAFNDGDKGIRPDLKGVIILTQNAFQSKRLPDEYGHTFIADDPLPEYFGKSEIVVRNKSAKPIVGFDGLAGESTLKNIYRVFRNIQHNIDYALGRTIFAPDRLLPGTYTRERAIRLIEKDNRIVANFNKRTAFRAGAKDASDQRVKTTEFYTNMMESDYVLCCRGVGNFSKRFYETLAMGRIPVFVNTDCILPFDNVIDWKNYLVWVEEKEINHLCDRIEEHYNSMTNDQFHNMQKSCRALYEKYLTEYGELTSLPALL